MYVGLIERKGKSLSTGLQAAGLHGRQIHTTSKPLAPRFTYGIFVLTLMSALLMVAK